MSQLTLHRALHPPRTRARDALQRISFHALIGAMVFPVIAIIVLLVAVLDLL